MKTKIFSALSWFILIYFIFGGLSFYAGTGGKLKGVATTITKPLEYLIETAKTIRTSGLGNGHLYEPQGNNSINILDTNIFLINTVINDNKRYAEELNLKTGERSIIIDFEDHFEFTDPHARIKINRSSDKNYIVATSSNQGKLFCWYDRHILWSHDTQDSITFHHRIDIIRDSIVLVNVRKVDTINQQFVRNEGYASFDLSTGRLIEIWWINDHLEQIGILSEFDGSVLQKKDKTSRGTVKTKDFWHINDVTMFTNKSTPNDVLQIGDIILSLRNLNCFIIVRDQNIFKCFKGNFHKQHDVDIVNANTVSIFNNNCSDNNYPWEESFIGNIVYYNLRTKNDSSAFTDLGINTYSEGQFQHLKNFKLIENQNQNEVILLKNDNIVYRGEIRNTKDSSKVNLLNWTQIYF